MYKHLSEIIILIQKDTIQLLIFITNNFNHALRLSFFFLLMKVQIFFPKSPKSADIPPPPAPANANRHDQYGVLTCFLQEIKPHIC